MRINSSTTDTQTAAALSSSTGRKLFYHAHILFYHAHIQTSTHLMQTMGLCRQVRIRVSFVQALFLLFIIFDLTPTPGSVTNSQTLSPESTGTAVVRKYIGKERERELSK